MNSDIQELTFTCPGLADPASVAVISGDLAVEDFVLQDEVFDFYNFFDVAQQYGLNDNWMLHILEGTGVRQYQKERENHTLYQAAFFLATYFLRVAQNHIDGLHLSSRNGLLKRNGIER